MCPPPLSAPGVVSLSGRMRSNLEAEAVPLRRLEPYRADKAAQRALTDRARNLQGERDKLRTAIERAEGLLREWGGDPSCGDAAVIAEAPQIQIHNTLLSAKEVGRLEMFVAGLQAEIKRLAQALERKLAVLKSLQLEMPLQGRRSPGEQWDALVSPPPAQEDASMCSFQSSLFDASSASQTNAAASFALPLPLPLPRPPVPALQATASRRESTAENAGININSPGSSRSSASSPSASSPSASSPSASSLSTNPRPRRINEKRPLPFTPVTSKSGAKVVVDERLWRVGHWPEFTTEELRSREKVHPKRFSWSPRLPIADLASTLVRGSERAARKYKKEYHDQSFSRAKPPSADSAARLWREKAAVLGLGKTPHVHIPSGLQPASKPLAAALYSLHSVSHP